MGSWGKEWERREGDMGENQPMRRAAVTGREWGAEPGWLEELDGRPGHCEASVVQGRPQLAQEEPLLPGLP